MSPPSTLSHPRAAPGQAHSSHDRRLDGLPDRGFRHEALFYADGDDGFLSGLLAPVERALDADGAAMVAVGPDRTAALRESLGDRASCVRFIEMQRAGRNPAVIISLWAEFLQGADVEGPIVGIGEPVWPARAPAELEECERHEALLNVAFDHGPPWQLICPYDLDGLDDAILEAAHRTHPVLVRDGIGECSTCYPGSSEPGPFAGELEPRPADAAEMAFAPADLPDLRAHLATWSAGHSASQALQEELVLAVHELATNSILHGGGHGTLRVWRQDTTLLCEIEDRGRMEPPLVGRLRPEPDAHDGRGVWIANQLCDLVQIRSGGNGTVVRVHKALG